MNETYLMISGAFLLLAAALGFKKPRSRSDQVNSGAAVGIEQVIANILNDAPKIETSPANGFTQSIAPAAPKVYPRDRQLTVNEVAEIAMMVNDSYFGGQIDPFLLVAMAKQESSFKPWATRNESRGRKSVGLMQTLIGTAQEMYGRGYNAYGAPTESNLKNPVVSMYFGAAYFYHLMQSYPDRYGSGSDYYAWYVRAYNGGAGWNNSDKGRSMTAVHWSKVKAHRDAVTRQISINVGV